MKFCKDPLTARHIKSESAQQLAMIAQSTAPTGEVVEGGEVSELVLGVAASLHHEGGRGQGH